MKIYAVLFAACVAALASVTAAQPLSLTPLGTVKSGPFRADDPRVAEINPRTDNGHAVFFELRGALPPRFVAALEVGAGPDMITFTDDGKYVLTANEGEPNLAYTIDPLGSVSIIEINEMGAPRPCATSVSKGSTRPSIARPWRRPASGFSGPTPACHRTSSRSTSPPPRTRPT